MKTIILNRKDIYRGSLVLIDHNHRLKDDYQVELEKIIIEMADKVLKKFNDDLQIVLQNQLSSKCRCKNRISIIKVDYQFNLTVKFIVNYKEIELIKPRILDKIIYQKAVKYGFIEISQREKGASKLWYFRYVGLPHSMIISNNHWDLKKYLQWIKRYSIYDPYLCIDKNRIVEIFYLPSRALETKICLSEKRKYYLSGNNYDGFIISARRLYD